MELIIKGPGGNELEWTDDAPNGLKKFTWPVHQTKTIKAHFGQMAFCHYKGNGFDIWFSNYLIKHATKVIGQVDMPGLELHMQFYNRLSADWDGIGKKLIRQDQYNLTYTPSIKSETAFDPNNQYTTFDIHFCPKYLERYTEDVPLLKQFLDQIDNKKAVQLFPTDRMLTPFMKWQIKSILNCHYTGALAVSHIEARVTDLLNHMLYNASNYYAQPVVLMTSDIKKLEMAAEILITQVNKKITIPQLAQMVCLNRKKLKMGFKQVFEVTVYEFAQKAKISKAAELLLETEMTIEEIAIELGYSGASSLSIPFKKYFKTTPDEFRYHKPTGLIKHIQSAKSLKSL